VLALVAVGGTQGGALMSRTVPLVLLVLVVLVAARGGARFRR
jgi:hypothetical protein